MRPAENELLTRVGPGTAMGARREERVAGAAPRILVLPGQQLVRV